MACTQATINPPQPDYSILPDTLEPTALQSYLDKDDKKTLKICGDFLQLCGFRSIQECDNILYKMASNIKALELFLQKFNSTH